MNILIELTTNLIFCSLSATVTICCLFLPKLSIILLHPEKNVRQSMMTQSKKGVPSTTKGPQTTYNAVTDYSAKLAVPAVPPAIKLNQNQRNGPLTLGGSASCGATNGKHASVVIITNDDPKENGNLHILYYCSHFVLYNRTWALMFILAYLCRKTTYSM